MRDAPSTTAEVVALMRASDQRRDPKERILDDPYAASFLGAVSKRALTTFNKTGKLGVLAEEQLSFGVTAFVLARHRFMDECLEHALDTDDALSQVVLLGAGYDTRAYRFASQLSGRTVFEVDHPATSRRKAELAEAAPDLPSANIRRVEIDFETQGLEERLLDSGFSKGERTFFIWEGVSMYLTRDAIKATLRTIRELSKTGSHLTMDYWYLLDSPSLLTTAHRAAANLLHFLGEPITFGIHPEDVGAFLEREGLKLEESAIAEDLEARYVPDSRRVYPAAFVIHATTV